MPHQVHDALHRAMSDFELSRVQTEAAHGAGSGDRRSGEVRPTENARSNRGTASPAGNRSNSGGDDRSGTGRNITIHRGSGVAS